MKKIAAFLIAYLIAGAMSVSVYAEDTEYTWTRASIPTEIATETSAETEITTATETSTSETTSTEVDTSASETTTLIITTTIDEEKEMLKQQVEDLSAMLESYGLTIDDLNMSIEELQNELTAANNRAASSSNNSGGSSGGNSDSQGSSNSSSSLKATEVTTIATTTPTTTSSTSSITSETTVSPDLKGNASLVEATEKEETKRDFITISTKDGSVFYLVIDYEGENENVYFLNKVDTADLDAILDPDGTGTQTTVTTEETTIVTEAVATEEDTKSGGIPTPLLLVLGLGLFAGGYYILKIKPGKNEVPDDDDDDDGYKEEAIEEEKEEVEE